MSASSSATIPKHATSDFIYEQRNDRLALRKALQYWVKGNRTKTRESGMMIKMIQEHLHRLNRDRRREAEERHVSRLRDRRNITKVRGTYSPRPQRPPAKPAKTLGSSIPTAGDKVKQVAKAPARVEEKVAAVAKAVTAVSTVTLVAAKPKEALTPQPLLPFGTHIPGSVCRYGPLIPA